jgi:hypothetical protein
MKIPCNGLLPVGLFLLAEAAFAGHIGEPFSTNLYSYVEGNPLSFIDPNGLDRRGVGNRSLLAPARVGPDQRVHERAERGCRKFVRQHPALQDAVSRGHDLVSQRLKQ